jgi:hypothetical protein
MAICSDCGMGYDEDNESQPCCPTCGFDDFETDRVGNGDDWGDYEPFVEPDHEQSLKLHFPIQIAVAEETAMGQVLRMDIERGEAFEGHKAIFITAWPTHIHGRLQYTHQFMIQLNHTPAGWQDKIVMGSLICEHPITLNAQKHKQLIAAEEEAKDAEARELAQQAKEDACNLGLDLCKKFSRHVFEIKDALWYPITNDMTGVYLTILRVPSS